MRLFRRRAFHHGNARGSQRKGSHVSVSPLSAARPAHAPVITAETPSVHSVLGSVDDSTGRIDSNFPVGRYCGEKREGPRRTADPIAWKLKIRRGCTSFDVSQRCVEPNDIGPEIPAIRALVLIRAVRLKRVVPAIAVVVFDETDIVDGLREHVARWPTRRRKLDRRCNQAVVAECKGGETFGDAGDRDRKSIRLN